MRLGVFLATFGGVLLVLLLVVPLPFGPPSRLPVATRAHVTLPYCLRMSYREVEDGRYLPVAVRLDESTMFQGTPWRRGVAYWHNWEDDAWWRLVDPDSLDITWYHGEVIRLPIRADSASGTVWWAGVAPLFAWPVTLQRPGSAQVISCDSLPKPAT